MAEKIQMKIREAKALKEFGTILARIYRRDIQFGDHKRAAKIKKYIDDTVALLDELDIYGEEKNRERTIEEINQLLDKK